jgi:hypothetical protein
MLSIRPELALLRAVLLCAVLVGMHFGSTVTAQAESGCAVTISGCFAKAKKKPSPEASNVGSDALYEQSSSYRAALRAGREACRREGVAEERCGIAFTSASGAPAGADVNPQQAALTAAARLPLQPGQPTVGPPPELNKWKMAAVGYPLWIWAEGNLDPAPVSQSVSGLTVSLDASLAKIVYDLGDGTKITCGPGTPWHKGKVAPGTPSPDCGHTYTKPSLPKGKYTITATTHWSVAWTAGGQSGTIPFTQSSTTTLPVGEVQTLVR